MGTDPAHSVADAFGRVHEIDNLFLGDGSVFVSAGGMNPTLTIMALSLRMAQHIGGVKMKAVHRRRRRAARRKRASSRHRPIFTG